MARKKKGHVLYNSRIFHHECVYKISFHGEVRCVRETSIREKKGIDCLRFSFTRNNFYAFTPVMLKIHCKFLVSRAISPKQKRIDRRFL